MSIIPINLINNSKTIEQYSSNNGVSLSMNLKPKQSRWDDELGYPNQKLLLDYGGMGYSTFNNYINDNPIFHLKNYEAIGAIGNAKKWSRTSTWLQNTQSTIVRNYTSTKSAYELAIMDNNFEVIPTHVLIDIEWISHNDKRETCLLVDEFFINDVESKKLYILWSIFAENQNEIQHINLNISFNYF